MNVFLKVVLILSVFIFLRCNEKKEPLFILREDLHEIDFINQLTYTEELNPYTYRNFYNGGGVALGDINNDGLIDIYFTGNIVDNKLYLNRGDWVFQDITEQAGVACPEVWSTGASFVDINGDGFLDLYVCKAGKPGGDRRHNELFINQGDLTFKEMSREYNLDITGLSVHSAFFDYDRDGDLDCYLLNNSIRSVGGFDLVRDQRLIPDSEGNKFLENREGQFIDITEQAGIYSSKIGYGLGITLSDFNKDGWTDIFVSNDFFERDYLYINQRDGSFSEVAEQYFDAMSMGSMGADAADLNNDGEVDLFVTEMLPKPLERKKTKATYESWDKYKLAVDKGYFHQYPRNVLQRSYGEDGFLEIGRFSGVAASEWSWASLITDLDNDGLKDIFVSNGIHKDLLDRDYLAYMANEDIIKTMINAGEDVIMNLVEMMPSTPVSNQGFQNLGAFNFKEVTSDWGLYHESFSNGSSYGDLDNDGDVDLIVNNVNMPAFIYENQTDTSINKSISIKLKGKGKNSKAIGSKIIVHLIDGSSILSENYVSRGFQSSTSEVQVIGIGQVPLDYVDVIWPDGTISRHDKLSANGTYTFTWPDQSDSVQIAEKKMASVQLELMNSPIFQHRENTFSEFNRDRLLFKMSHNEGPGLAVGDVNKDGADDIFIGGAKNQESELWLSTPDGFVVQTKPFDQHFKSETVGAIFFDSDNDSDLDLFVMHGGRAFSIYSKELDDQLYINDGKGNFSIAELPDIKAISTGAAAVTDINGDGLSDIFIGERYDGVSYGLPGSGHLLINLGQNQFQLESPEVLNKIGMITTAIAADLDGDETQELIIAGEWMNIEILSFKQSGVKNVTNKYLKRNMSGLWHGIIAVDIDNDGDMDLVCGNIGENNFLPEGSKLYIGDFDQNGSTEQLVTVNQNGIDFPIHDMDEIVGQLPGLRKKVLYYKDYAAANVESLLGSEVLKESQVYEMSTRKSVVLLNQGGSLIEKQLPEEIQYSSVYSIEAGDFNKDGKTDLIFGGNQYLVKPQFGRDDASHGWIILGESNDGNYDFGTIEKLNIKGQIRNIKKLNTDQLSFAINNDTARIYKINY